MIIFFRFRKAAKAQGIEVPYQSWIQPYGAYIAITMFTLLCLINGFTVFFPENWSASSFLTAYIGIPIFLSVSSPPGYRSIANRHRCTSVIASCIDMTSGRGIRWRLTCILACRRS